MYLYIYIYIYVYMYLYPLSIPVHRPWHGRLSAEVPQPQVPQTLKPEMQRPSPFRALLQLVAERADLPD